jgi:PAS domain S-box-containing protein
LNIGDEPVNPAQIEELKNNSVLGLVLLSFFITEITIYHLSQGTIFVLSHLFYFPIILGAFLYPRRGILVSTGLGLVYVALTFLISDGALQDLTAATMQFYVFVSIGIVISCISLSIRESEKRYRELADLLPESIFELDMDGMFTFGNRSALERFGYSQDDIDNGVHASEVIVPEEHDRLHAVFSAYLQRNMARAYNFTALRSDGGHFPVVVYPGLIEREGRIVGIRGIAVDVSEQKMTEDRLRWMNNQLSIINEIIRTTASPGSVDASLDFALGRILSLLNIEAGAIYLINELGTMAQLRTVRHGGSELQDDLLSSIRSVDLSHPTFRGFFTSQEPKYFEDVNSQLPNNGKGLFPVPGILSFAVLPLIGEEQTFGAIFLADSRTRHFSGEEKDILESLGKELGNIIYCNILQEQLKASNEEANLYLDIMTHDLNNAETATQGYAEMIREMAGPDVLPLTEKLLLSIRQGIDIIGAVSTIRRIREKGRSLKPIHLNTVIEKQIALFSDVKITYSANGAVVLGDDLISEVFTNLIGNSRKFGGDDVAIAIRIEPAGYDYIISIEDDGPGIPDEVKHRLFTRFQPGSSSRSGKGLGLSICRMLVEQYGGRIWVEDLVPGDHESGTAVRFTLKKAILPDNSTHTAAGSP